MTKKGCERHFCRQDATWMSLRIGEWGLGINLLFVSLGRLYGGDDNSYDFITFTHYLISTIPNQRSEIPTQRSPIPIHKSLIAGFQRGSFFIRASLRWTCLTDTPNIPAAFLRSPLVWLST